MGYHGLPGREDHNGVNVTRVPALRKKQATCETSEMLSYVISALPRVIWRLWHNKYDIVHLHFVIPTGLLAWLATRFCRVPYVITAHGSDIPGYNPDRFKKEHHMTTPLLRTIMRNAAGLTSPSQYLRGLMIEKCGDFDVEHIPNGIDVQRFKSTEKQRRILMTGRLLPRKGFQHVLRALQDIDTDYEVHIAGDGPTREELEKLAKGVKTKVLFHGWLENDSPMLKELYETSAIFCLPSERENGSISLLEAMLSGMAVITSNVTGCPETVGDTGLVVPPDDPQSIRQALNILLGSDELCNEYGEKARRRVLELYDWEIIGDSYIQMFENITQV